MSENPDAVANAWRIHEAQLQWTSQVDSKASFVLAIESGLTVGVVTLSGDGHRLTHLDDAFTKGAYMSGVFLIVAGLLAVAFVVRPRLRKNDMPKEGDEKVDYIFFGHAMQWDAEELQSALCTGEILPVLTRQITRTSRIAWTKHVALQWSITLAAIGTALVGVAAWTN